jgi:acetamidase/formamidase
VPSDWGLSQVGNTILNHDPRVGVPEGKSLFFTWDIDNEKKVCSNHAGFSLPITPFMGVMCVAPDVDGYLSTYFPYKFGGNLDCRELVAGSKLYLPVMTQGALFSTGDGHAVQGDGEVCGTAVECPMQRVSLTFTLHKDRMLEGPRALTPSGWITFGFGEDLTDAAYDAINEMVSLIMQKLGCERLAALQLASMAVDLRVTQMVNTVRGVHAVLFKERVCHSCKAWEAL